MQDYYSTSDINLVAYMRYNGAEIQRVDRKDPLHVTFTMFHKDVEGLAKEYLDKRPIQIIPYNLFCSLREAKTALYK